jgi:hypothetical protein
MARMHLRVESIALKLMRIDIFDFDAARAIVDQIESVISSGDPCPEVVFVEVPT